MAEKPYIATQDIFVAANIRAHRAGDVVPDENVKANGWEALVSREGTKAATEAQSAE